MLADQLLMKIEMKNIQPVPWVRANFIVDIK